MRIDSLLKGLVVTWYWEGERGALLVVNDMISQLKYGFNCFNWLISCSYQTRFSSGSLAQLDPSTNSEWLSLCWSQSSTLLSVHSVKLFWLISITYIPICQITVKSISSPLSHTQTIYNLILLNTSLCTTLSVLLLSWLCSGRSTEVLNSEVHHIKLFI